MDGYGVERYIFRTYQRSDWLFLAFEIPLPACAMSDRLLNSSAKVLYDAHLSHFKEYIQYYRTFFLSALVSKIPVPTSPKLPRTTRMITNALAS
jgi:hypothetical protein